MGRARARASTCGDVGATSYIDVIRRLRIEEYLKPIMDVFEADDLDSARTRGRRNLKSITSVFNGAENEGRNESIGTYLAPVRGR
jgi:hypothetical protein